MQRSAPGSKVHTTHCTTTHHNTPHTVNKFIPWDYGIALIVVGIVSTLMGQTLVTWLVRRAGRPSILVITLALMFIVSAGERRVPSAFAAVLD